MQIQYVSTGLLGPPIAPETWLAGWTYRKAVTLSRASGQVADYQMKLLVGESSGATGENVDCEGHCASDFDDLRFTASDGTTLLPYWIESITGTTPNQLATVWIKFDSIGTSDTTFYLYYGNASAPAVSNGVNTFIFFDDFERGSDGDTVGGDWTESTAHCHISTEQDIGNVAGFFGSRGLKVLGASGSYAECCVSLAGQSQVYAIRLKVYKETAAIFYISHGNGTKRFFVRADTSEDIEYSDGTWHDTGSNVSADAWFTLGIANIDFTGGTFDIYYDDALVESSIGMHASATTTNTVAVVGDGAASGRDSWVDNFIIRNWRATEPAWGSWGSEETEP
jgi:hypothetical protein